MVVADQGGTENQTNLGPGDVPTTRWDRARDRGGEAIRRCFSSIASITYLRPRCPLVACRFDHSAEPVPTSFPPVDFSAPTAQVGTVPGTGGNSIQNGVFINQNKCLEAISTHPENSSVWRGLIQHVRRQFCNQNSSSPRRSFWQSSGGRGWSGPPGKSHGGQRIERSSHLRVGGYRHRAPAPFPSARADSWHPDDLLVSCGGAASEGDPARTNRPRAGGGGHASASRPRPALEAALDHCR